MDLRIGDTVKLSLIKSVSLLLIFTALAAVSAFAQTNDAVLRACDSKVKAPDYSLPAWPENAKVKVYIVGTDFNPAEITAMLPPLTNWSAIAEASGSHVTFLYSGTVVSLRIA